MATRKRALGRLWDRRVGQWADTVHASPVFATIRDRMLEMAEPSPSDRCVDLGAGTGFLSIPLAQRAGEVLAVDLSPAMLEALSERAAAAGVEIRTQAGDMAGVELPAGSVDLVVSAYAMHYLVNEEKKRLLAAIGQWLAPGGRLVVSDMMLGRSLDQHHRRVLAEKAVAMARRGPAGWWRLAKNVLRIATDRGRLHPCPPDWWMRALTEAGFTDVRYEHVSSEAGIVAGRR